jgi:hypothetical protein
MQVSFVNKAPGFGPTNKNTVNIHNPERLDFEWSFSRRFLSPVFECFGCHSALENHTKIVRFSNGPASLDRFIQKKIFFKYKMV